MADISSTRMSLFVICRELHFGVCNHGEWGTTPHNAKEELFFRGDEKVGWAIVKRTWRLMRWAVAWKEEETFFLLLDSAIVVDYESAPFWSPDYLIAISDFFFTMIILFKLFPDLQYWCSCKHTVCKHIKILGSRHIMDI